MPLKMKVAVVTPEVTAPPEVQKVPVAPVTPTETEQWATEFIALWEQYEALGVKELTKRMEQLKKSLQTRANEEVEPEKPAIFVCEAGEVEFSKRGESSEVKDPLALINHLVEKFGVDVAFSVVNIALTPLRKILGDIELAKFIEKKPGSRTLASVRPTK